MPALQSGPLTSSSPPPPLSVRVSLPGQPDLGAPREWNVVGRYLQDPSLRYTKVPFAGPSIGRILGQGVGFVAGLSFFFVPLIRQAVMKEFSFGSLFALVGIPICVLLAIPTRNMLLELHNKFRHRRVFRNVDLGLERAVPQPGTNLRYEVHLNARRKTTLAAVHVRLVFWESWKSKRKLRVVRIPLWKTEKQGHDLVRHELGPVEMNKGQHAVIRGSLSIPAIRPTEHHRGKPKHIAYVNVTITLVSDQARPSHAVRGNCPHLVTFPWM